ncbi:cytochrome b [Idiomarina fontislapidosi]|uniref:Cytochrome B n=1 Tax=Idiomarina fontislapidosi TaxID=263723 RepID=A0A432XX66_9GAMM|nr:cytochrome b/b6 domain-containing protein [Idiomarina fontislapidosi]PYE32129.1 cytochrome b [Idiomarina fontislapidosi]RUO53332.1 cytochrome B [Idiomarina fontislapidosi]
MNEKYQRIKIWDSYIRIYHWLMVAAVAGLWWTGEQGRMDLHQDIAIALAALLITRIGWGFFGSRNVRFRHFIQSPKRVVSHVGALFGRRYQQGNTHSPAGGYSVVALLLILVVQIATGLFATDGILFSGPLNSWVSSDTADLLTDWHKAQFNFILGLVVLHIVAIVIYRLLGHRLLAAMVTGYRYTSAQVPALKPGWQGLVIALAVWFILVMLL